MQSPTLFQNFKSFTNPHACMSCLPWLLRCLPCGRLMINFIKLLQWGNIINIRSIIINLWGFIPKFMSSGIVNPSAINLSFFRFSQRILNTQKRIYTLISVCCWVHWGVEYHCMHCCMIIWTHFQSQR